MVPKVIGYFKRLPPKQLVTVEFTETSEAVNKETHKLINSLTTSSESLLNSDFKQSPFSKSFPRKLFRSA
ncbi:hypothetical protein TNCV_1639341 [Trichonephila clavipes]|nr:hypothetical protein TNCV_1639341 [Trichonephila clavipes]